MKRSSTASPTTLGAQNQLTVTFHGPHVLCNETKDVLADCAHRKAAGIFLTAVLVGDSYRITHIGQTGTSFYARLKEHVIQTLGGNFRICDPKAMARGEIKVLWDGLWRPGRHANLPEYLRNGPALFEAARECFKLEKAFVAPLDVEDRMRRRIEDAHCQANSQGQICFQPVSARRSLSPQAEHGSADHHPHRYAEEDSRLARATGSLGCIRLAGVGERLRRTKNPCPIASGSATLLT